MPNAPRWLVNLFAFSGLSVIAYLVAANFTRTQWAAFAAVCGVYFVAVVLIGVWQGLSRYGRE